MLLLLRTATFLFCWSFSRNPFFAALLATVITVALCCFVGIPECQFLELKAKFPDEGFKGQNPKLKQAVKQDITKEEREQIIEHLRLRPDAEANSNVRQLASSARCTLPIGGGVGKLFKLGKLPINAQLAAYCNVVKPQQGGADWQLRFQVQFLFPK
jgi:hypothetical protein